MELTEQPPSSAPDLTGPAARPQAGSQVAEGLLPGASGGIALAAAAALPACRLDDTAAAQGTTAPTGPPSATDATRFLTQATFGMQSVDEVALLQAQRFGPWMEQQFQLPARSHVGYLDQWKSSRGRKNVPEESSYEAVWQQWLWGEDQLRGRMSWALLQIFVISNVAPDIRPYAMSSYMDMLNAHAFGNYRDLLEAVTLHPAMGYYLNMLRSEQENPDAGTHPNENYAREVLQLFSVGLVQLNPDGSPRQRDGQDIPTYDEAVVKGYAAAFTGWSLGAEDTTDPNRFHDHDENNNANWLMPMKPWPARHDTGTKTLLDGQVLPAGQTPQKDLADALDSIFRHPNVGPFIGRQLIQRLVSSNPSVAYVRRVAEAFADNGRGVRGDLKAVLRAILLDPEARGDDKAGQLDYGKQREPVIRFANFLRGLGARSDNGENAVHELEIGGNHLGQSPLLAPSVFNFYQPSHRPAGPLADANLAAPEFQITNEASVVGTLNFFSRLFGSRTYGYGSSQLKLDYGPLIELVPTPDLLVNRMDQLFFNRSMSAATRSRLLALLSALATRLPDNQVIALLKVVAMSPDFVIQR